MPVYEYECEEHGVFELLRPIAERAEPAPCPNCEQAAARVVSVPRLSGMSRPTLIAHERNERSRHEPRHVHTGHAHGSHAHGSAAPSAPGQRPALKRYTGARPWVVEHS